ncbi:MAG: hypothetical protein IJU72_03795 [Bacteroidales bacterium]|nr:hypothetical protein [Bacteroidales bacterium]
MRKYNKLITISLIIYCLLLLAGHSALAQKHPVFDRGIEQSLFVPKHQYFAGFGASYTVVESNDYRLLVMEDLRGEGYSLSVSPYMGYTFADNMGAGVRFRYKRTMVDLRGVTISLSEGLSFGLNDAYMITHSYYGTAFFRSYASIGNSKRFGFYNDIQVTLGGGQSKTTLGKGETQTGTYQTFKELEVGIVPGLVAFFNNFAAVDVSISVLGFNVKRVDQVTNQVYKGGMKSTAANFRLNLLSVNLGVSFYIPTLNPF